MNRFIRMAVVGTALATLTSPLAASHAAPAAPAETRAIPDDRVIFQSFSLFQPYESNMYARLAGQTEQLRSWGITDVWLPPAYRSFGMARYLEGYAVADRYDLGEFPQGPNGQVATKYGTAAELKSLMSTLHGQDLRGQMDLVPNQMLGLSGREAVQATRTDQHGNVYVAKDGRRTEFVNQIYLAYTKGGGPGQARYGRIKEFTKAHWNGTSLQQIGFGDTLRDANGRPYRVDQPRAADNNVPPWMDVSLGHNTVEGYLSARDAYENGPGNWRPYLIQDPNFVRYAIANCGYADETAVKSGGGSVAIWTCRDRFIDQSQAYSADRPNALAGTRYNYWGEEPTVDNSTTGIDWPDQLRFAGHPNLNQGFGGKEEFLVGNDFDNARPDMQAEQRHWVKWLLDTYGFDGFRVDAAAHYPTPLLDAVAQETRAKFNGDPNRYLNYLESYDTGAMNRYIDAAGNGMLTYDARLFFTLRDSLGGRAPVGNLWTNSDAFVAGDRAGGAATYRPNWSFVTNHDQEKELVNAEMLRQLGIRQGGCTGGPLQCRSLNVEWSAERQQPALDEWNRDLARPSSQKRISPKNVPARYAAILTNEGTTPTVYYGDLYRTDGTYMAERTPYHDEITNLLQARKAYAKGGQRSYDFGSDTAASVRLGTSRGTGLATVISNNPRVDKVVSVPMGRTHVNQAYRDVTGKNPQTLITDGMGTLNIPVRGSENTPEVSGYLGVWAPVDDTEQKVTHGAIRAKWLTSQATLGQPISGEYCFLRDGGCFQRFERGSIYWSPTTGAHWIRGRIRDRWGSVNWEYGPLGYPTSDEFCGLRDGGCAQRFQHGLIYWTPGTDAHVVWGAIEDAYAAQGWETGDLRYPTGGEFCGLRDGGCGQRFQGGMIYWSPRTGAHVVKGRILDEYAARRWEAGPLGYPTSSERCDANGCVQTFQRGRITWSLAAGARTVL